MPKQNKHSKAGGGKSKCLPIYCNACGAGVGKTDTMCPNDLCENSIFEQKFAEQDMNFCVWCQSFPNNLNASYKQCPNCKHKLNAVMVNIFRNVYH